MSPEVLVFSRFNCFKSLSSLNSLSSEPLTSGRFDKSIPSTQQLCRSLRSLQPSKRGKHFVFFSTYLQGLVIELMPSGRTSFSWVTYRNIHLYLLPANELGWKILNSSKEVQKSNFRQYAELKSRVEVSSRVEMSSQQKEDQHACRVIRKKVHARKMLGTSRIAAFFQ